MARRGGELAARIRAARAYADLSRQQLGATLGFSVETISRLEAGTRSADADERRAIAEACEVPIEFLEVGFALLERPLTNVELRLVQLERMVRDLAAAVAPERERQEADVVMRDGQGEVVALLDFKEPEELSDEAARRLVAAFETAVTRQAQADELPADPAARGRRAAGGPRSTG